MPITYRFNGSLVRPAPVFNSAAHAISYLKNRGYLERQTSAYVYVRMPIILSRTLYDTVGAAERMITDAGKTIRHL